MCSGLLLQWYRKHAWNSHQKDWRWWLQFSFWQRCSKRWSSCRSAVNSRWQLPQGLRRRASTHSSLPLLLLQLLPHPEELFVLAGNKINGRVLQQCSKHKKQAHRHPDVYGLHVGHLWIQENLSSGITKLAGVQCETVSGPLKRGPQHMNSWFSRRSLLCCRATSEKTLLKW